MNKKILILPTLLSYLAVFLIIVAINWYITPRLSLLMVYSFLYFLIYLIPLVAVNYYCFKYFQIEKSKKFFLKITLKPLEVISKIILVFFVPALIFDFFFCGGGEFCGFLSIATIVQGAILIVTSIIFSLAIGSILYFLKGKQRGIVVGLIFLLIFLVLASIIFTGKASGCPPQDTKCLAQKVIKENDVSICEAASTQALSEVCYKNIAGESGDESICEFIKDSGRKIWCYQSVIFNSKNNVCINISDIDQKKSCFTRLCNKIEFDDHRKSCLEDIIHGFNLKE